MAEPQTAPTANEWEFHQDDDFPDGQLDAVSIAAGGLEQWSAGSATFSARDDHDKLLTIVSVAHIGDRHVAVYVDPADGRVLWASRPAPGEHIEAERLGYEGPAL